MSWAARRTPHHNEGRTPGPTGFDTQNIANRPGVVKACAYRLPLRIIEAVPAFRAVSSVGQSASFTPRRSEVQVLHRPPVQGTWELWASARTPAGRGGGTADALRSGRSVLTDVWVQIPPSAPNSAPRACSSEDRALPCGGRGREFESRQARHFLPSTVLMPPS